MSEYLLEMRDIVKTFPGVRALDGVNLRVASGQVHALVGENGAGKSTLMKVLSGVHGHGSYTGDILLNAKTCEFSSINDSENEGIAIIHQELALVSSMSITENMFLGHEIHRKGLVNWPKAHARTRELLEPVGLDEDPQTLVGTLGVGKQQLIEIARALAKDVSLLILDEPTASLNDHDSQTLLTLLSKLRDDGLTAILISHKLNEVSQVSDAVTILRDGTTVETIDCQKEELSTDRVVLGMVGREITQRFPAHNRELGDVAFEISNWSVGHPTQQARLMVDDVSLTVRAGEVVGISGLMGAGRTELAMSVFGQSYGRKLSGSFRKNGEELDVSSVPTAIKNGIAYVTEDRKELGLVLEADIQENISLSNLQGVSSGPFLNSALEAKVALGYRDSMNIRCRGVDQSAVTLSGGNQQKVVLSKWMFTSPDLLILDEPTRGIDVGAKYEIYELINRIVEEGRSVILISSELPEVLGMSDRVYVMNEGNLVGELDTKTASSEDVMQLIMRDYAIDEPASAELV